MRILTILFALTISFASAQNLPEILTTTQYKRGVYKNYAEFVMNSPSIELDENLSRSQIFNDPVFATKARWDFWGICDGKKVYVNEERFLNTHPKYSLSLGDDRKITYREILGIGRYCFLRGVLSSPPPSGYNMPNGAMPTMPRVSMTRQAGDFMLFILNTNNGSFHELTKPVLETILKSDSELYGRYKKESGNGKDDIMLIYLIEYNKKHIEEASLVSPDPIDIIVYRRNIDQSDQALKVTINDSLSFDLGPNQRIKYSGNYRIVKMCLNGDCYQVLLDRKSNTYVECDWKNADDAPEAEKVDPKKGELHVNIIERKLKGN